MRHVNRSFTLERHGRLGEGASLQFRLNSECDGGSGQDGARNDTSGPKGGGGADSPEDVLRFGSILQDEKCVRSGNQGGTSLKEKHGVGLVQSVQRDHSARGEVDSTSGTVGSGLESHASHFDCHGLPIGSDCHRLRVGDQNGSGEISRV
jgi:hypothetical protein